jgi:hypothetical protein
VSRLNQAVSARPRNLVRPEDCRVVTGKCQACGQPTPRLVPQIPPGEGGGANQFAPSYELVGDLANYILPGALPCSRCRLVAALATLFPPRPGRIMTDIEREMEALRGERATRDNPHAPAPAIAKGRLFDPGEFHVTDLAGAFLHKTHPRPGHPVDSPLASELGRMLAPGFLERHCRGDHGIFGMAGDGDPARGERIQDYPPALDRNAFTLKSGRGSVRSLFRLFRPDQHYLAHDVAVRSEIGGAGPNLTVVFALHEIP